MLYLIVLRSNLSQNLRKNFKQNVYSVNKILRSKNRWFTRNCKLKFGCLFFWPTRYYTSYPILLSLLQIFIKSSLHLDDFQSTQSHPLITFELCPSVQIITKAVGVGLTLSFKQASFNKCKTKKKFLDCTAVRIHVEN